LTLRARMGWVRVFIVDKVENWCGRWDNIRENPHLRTNSVTPENINV